MQLIGVWFVTDKISYSIGLWYGIAIAVGIAVNIATVIYLSLIHIFDGPGVEWNGAGSDGQRIWRAKAGLNDGQYERLCTQGTDGD